MGLLVQQGNDPAAPRRRLLAPLGRALDGLGRRHPFVAFFLLVILSNVAGSIFSFYYNTNVIIRRHMTERQEWAFWNVAAPLYNVLAYPICVGLMLYVLWPLYRCLRRLRRDEAIEPAYLEYCRRRVINLPWIQVILNLAGWLPGAFFFPLVVCLGWDHHHASAIWAHFFVSFAISALFTTAQTFFMMQYFLIGYFFPDLFRDARPEDIPGIHHIAYVQRLVLLWLAVAWMPLIAMFVALGAIDDLFAVFLFLASSFSSGFIFYWVGRDLLRWIQTYSRATAEIARENFQVRIIEPRPDVWGQLNNRFNDMASALARAQYVRETFGEFVSPEVSEIILERMQGLYVEIREITVLFVDIRGFSRRCASEPPERVGTLLNQFLTLTLAAIEEKGGYVNSFLGDGAMALFNAPLDRDDHADLALTCADELLRRLGELNRELEAQGHAPLKIGIGIHTGPALVGCFGAVLPGKDRLRYRRQLTAIGETVNTCQRIEQLTKQCGGPILLSEQTRAQLRQERRDLICLGPHDLAGCPEPLVVHKVRGA